MRGCSAAAALTLSRAGVRSREIYAGILKTTPHVPGAECVLAALRWVQIINRLLQNFVVDKARDSAARTKIGAIFYEEMSYFYDV